VLLKVRRKAVVGDLMRNSGNGQHVIQVAEVLNGGYILRCNSYGNVRFNVWSYAKRKRTTWLSRQSGDGHAAYFSAGTNTYWLYDVVIKVDS